MENMGESRSHGPKSDTQEPPSLPPPLLPLASDRGLSIAPTAHSKGRSIEPYLPAPMPHYKQHGPRVQAQRARTHFLPILASKKKKKDTPFEKTHGVTTDDKSSERNDEPPHLGRRHAKPRTKSQANLNHAV